MGYIDKSIAMQYLMGNERIFLKIKDSFLSSYRNYKEDYLKLVNEKNFKELERYIHSLKGISLNLGAQKLYDVAVLNLTKLRSEIWDLESIDKFLDCLSNTYNELSNL